MKQLPMEHLRGKRRNELNHQSGTSVDWDTTSSTLEHPANREETTMKLQQSNTMGNLQEKIRRKLKETKTEERGCSRSQ